MKRSLLLVLSFLAVACIAVGFYFIPGVRASIERLFEGDEPDLPDFARYKVNKEEFMTRRAESIAELRGLKGDNPVDPMRRIEAIAEMKRQEDRRAAMPDSDLKTELGVAWTELGPNPIPNGQVDNGPQTPVSGRTTAIAVHPSNPDIVYVGTAQGGLYRSINGGTTWTPMMDDALSLAIGAVAIAPSQPDTVYVGTGEPNFSADSFFGVGVYRIDNASTATPIITGPLNDDATDADIFTGRAISEIIVHPSDPATIFVASTSGVGGIMNTAPAILPARGIYRSTDATSADPTFTKLTGLNANTNNNVRDIAIDPLNPNLMVANVVFAANPATSTSGIYVSTDALALSPTFTQRVVFTSTSTSELTAEFAVQHIVGQPNPTIYAAVGNATGGLYINTDGGTVWTLQNTTNFCNPQCFYDIAIDVDPTNPANVYIGGAPALVFGRSINSGVNFTTDTQTAVSLHVDSHAIAVAPSNPAIVYFGSDGGIYKTTNASATPIVWTNLNNSTFRATQFMSIAVHSTDPNFSIGGTQDNGTNFFQPAGTWTRVDSGDGGYALIDQVDTTIGADVYHTYFNAVDLQGYGRANTASGPYSFRGCQAAGATVNGITCNGTVRFYAPLEQGPPVTGSLGNTIYYGSDRLYRSIDTGLTHTVVSQNPIVSGVSMSAIGISPQNDDVRVVGLSNGAIFGTSTGANPLVDLDPSNSIPNNAIARAVVDPNDQNTAYITLSAFGVTNVWKTTTLGSRGDGLVPTWTAAAGTGANVLPQIPVNALVVDPANSQRLYAGTDIGVFTSADGGTNWVPFGTGLPAIAVFDMAITNAAPRQVRIATHGRGFWQIPALAPTAANVSVSGRVFSALGSGISRAAVSVTDSQGNTRTTLTNPFGYYRFDDVASGQTYAFSVRAKGYTFQPQIVTVADELTDLDFIAGK
jgi:hypothetical protein